MPRPFYASRTTLYADCRGRCRAIRRRAGGAAGGRGQRRSQAPVVGAASRRRGGRQGPAIGIPGFYKLEDTNGDDVMDTIERIQRYTTTDGRPRSARRPARPGRLDHVHDRQQHLRRRARR